MRWRDGNPLRRLRRGRLWRWVLQGVHYLYYTTLAGRTHLQPFFQGQACGEGFLPDSKESCVGGGEAHEATVTAASLCDGHTLAAGDASKVEEGLRAAKGHMSTERGGASARIAVAGSPINCRAHLG